MTVKSKFAASRIWLDAEKSLEFGADMLWIQFLSAEPARYRAGESRARLSSACLQESFNVALFVNEAKENVNE